MNIAIVVFFFKRRALSAVTIPAMITARRLTCATAMAILATCGVVETAPPAMPPAAQSAQPPTADSWQLSFQLSGGFAGVDRRLELASTGDLRARDRRRGTDVAARTPPDDVARIAALLAELKSIDSRGAGRCRDCLEYDLEIQRSGQSLVFHLQDTTLGSSGIAPLVKILTGLLDDAFAGRLSVQPAPG
jgi:hypothetical protein